MLLHCSTGAHFTHWRHSACLCTPPFAHDRHLTDFKGGFSNIRFRTASLSQMAPIPPEVLFTKLRLLAGLVFGLFGAMLLWGGFSWLQDIRGRKAVLRELMRPEASGFRQLDADAAGEGAWLWSLPPVVVESDGHLSGPFVNFARVIGLPFARVRAAIPPEFHRGEILSAAGFSSPACAENLTPHDDGGGSTPPNRRSANRAASSSRRYKFVTELDGINSDEKQTKWRSLNVPKEVSASNQNAPCKVGVQADGGDINDAEYMVRRNAGIVAPLL